MERSWIYIMNFTGEGIMCLILLFLLVTCFLQRKGMKTIQALMMLIIADIALLICQGVEWYLMIASLNEPIGNIPTFYNIKRIAYTLDYSFYYFVSLAFFNYVIVHIQDIKKNREKVDVDYSRWKIALFVWGIIITCVFIGFMSTNWFYYLDSNQKEMFHIVYFVLYGLGTTATISSLVVLVKNHDVLGHISTGLLTAYILVPYIFIVPDLVEGTCFAYLMIAFFAFVLYVHMDLRRKNEMTKQEEILIRQEKELTELSTQIMISQMQPHFLYNTFSTISGLCNTEGAPKAKQVVDKFAEYLQENFDAIGKEKFIPFEKELKHIETYLWIEQVRCNGSLNVEYDIGVSDFKVPSLSLQPLVENAVKHGIQKNEHGGTVFIKTQEFPGETMIIVSDDGAGFIGEKLQDDGGSHIGIKNIKQRLEALCGGTCEIHSSIGKGTTVTVHIPKKA